MRRGQAVIHQCKSCPWRVDCVPERDIPNGYSCQLHEQLRDTIAADTRVSAMVRVMACHYSEPGAEFPCAGWLHNQLGVGNNISARLAVMYGRLPIPDIDGEQHQTFDDTLPMARQEAGF